MEKKPQTTDAPDTAEVKNDDPAERLNEEPLEKEVDLDSKIHETSPNLIQKEDNRLPIDDEVKNG